MEYEYKCNVNINTNRFLIIPRGFQWFSNLLWTADTTTTLGTLRDMKNLKKKVIIWKQTKETSDEVVDDFDPTEDGEASEKTHCASYQAQLGLHCHLWIYIINM